MHCIPVEDETKKDLEVLSDEEFATDRRSLVRVGRVDVFELQSDVLQAILCNELEEKEIRVR